MSSMSLRFTPPCPALLLYSVFLLNGIIRLCEILLGIICACLPAAAYGFRHEGSIHHRLLHRSHYTASKQYNSKQYHSSISKPASNPRLGTADGESLISRSRIRCSTYVEILNEGKETDGVGHENRSTEEDVELTALPQVHLKAGQSAC